MNRQLTINGFDFKFNHFAALSGHDLMRIYRLRQAVFVVEQNCPYNDIDDEDLQAVHVCHWGESQLLGYARIIAAEDKVHIGRVVIALSHRRVGLGQALMLAAIEQCKNVYGQKDILISAQSYLMDFYRDVGFVDCGDYYLEDNIPHMKMIYKLNDK